MQNHLKICMLTTYTITAYETREKKSCVDITLIVSPRVGKSTV